ncbi:Glutathione-regulated potassium-efflux system protein KefC [Aliiroseovarius pelagivivens]|uniref:Glutathione-regulated potassium-efflux system protein KefC n=1 Tax=Aliiroseovarius pelagivivens TaxID=1639690 RepID=A0A2R8AHZ0_9RHOB|nr:cation:proton antiporter [Aliiroseovarius pelagivivens]SPF75474.1 Glutathione-regulated potassium-efflux system protein KefC [Aliiroseovarius pelagivivens]
MTAEFMLITFTLFLAGVIAVPIASRFGLGSVLGYLVAGIAISPILHWAGADVIALQHFAEFGVVMMLFIVGLEMNPKSLWEMRSRIFVLGGLQVGITTGAVLAVSLAFGLPMTVGLAIGLVLALSSTAIVNQTLREKGLLRSDGGQASFSVLLMQDIAVIPMLALIPLLAMPELSEALLHGAGHGDGHGDGHGGLNLSLVEGLNGWQTALVTLAAIAGVIFIGTYLTTPIFRFVAKARLRELFVTTALMMVLGIALLMTLVGLSPALGTFLAGVVMAGSEYRHELESDIDPFKGIFLGVFFITVGAGINFGLLGSNFAMIIGLTLGLIVLKAAVLMVLGRAFKLQAGDKWLFALGLAQAGEFGFVLLSFTVANAVIPQDIADVLLLVVALSMLLTPALFILYDRVIAPRYSSQEERQADEIEGEAPIIIAGHGRFGGIVNRALRGAGYDTTVLDYSSEQLEMLRRFHISVHFGDATRPDLLHAAGIDEAKVLVIAIDDKDAITELVRYMVEHHPNVHLVARAIDRNHVYDLWSVGCRDIIRETYDSSIRASRSVFEALGHTRPQAEKLLEEFEAADRDVMLDLAKLYDINIPPFENEAYMNRVDEMMDEWQEQLRGRMQEAKADKPAE